MSDTPKPTQGQQRILQLCCRTAYVLRGYQASPTSASAGEPVRYHLVERGTGRVVQSVMPAMVRWLKASGWIEHVPGGNANEWEYRVTAAGVAAANGPTRGA